MPYEPAPAFLFCQVLRPAVSKCVSRLVQGILPTRRYRDAIGNNATEASMSTFTSSIHRRHFLLCTSATVALSGLPFMTAAETPFVPPETAQGENGWETYIDPLMIDRAAAAGLRPGGPDTPEAAVVLFLASRIRGDRAWQDAMTGDLDRKAKKAVKQWKQWTLNAAQLKARKMRGEDRGYVSVWMDLTIDGDAETGTDEFTVKREANGWRIAGVPS